MSKKWKYALDRCGSLGRNAGTLVKYRELEIVGEQFPDPVYVIEEIPKNKSGIKVMFQSTFDQYFERVDIEKQIEDDKLREDKADE